ncbi:MAG TPA: chromate transporter, partial [Gemmatimonadales bacterium]|nr:chromate transporter [Gemmatimonadales bacterium]
GAKAVAFVVVLKALADFSRTALTTPTRWALALAALVANLLGGNELLVLGAAVVLGLALAQPRRGASAAAVAPAAPGLLAIFGLFAKIGAVLFGSGYVLLAFLHGDLVDRLHWLTDRQLLDAVAAGQLTPGPVFSTATFVGYLVAGTPGAAVATAGIFLPAFVFVALSGLVLPRLRTSPTFRGVLDAVIAASLGLMGAVTILLARAGLSSWPTGAIAAMAAIVLWRTKVNPAWILIGGVVAGWVVAG